MTDGGGVERRRHARKDFPAPAMLIVNGSEIGGTTTNVSISGALIAAEVQLAAAEDTDPVLSEGQVIKVSIPKISVSTASARIIRVTNTSRGSLIALQFDEIHTQIPTRILDTMLRGR